MSESIELNLVYMIIAVYTMFLTAVYLSLWYYLLKKRLPESEQRLKEEIPDMVWNSILKRIQNTKDPEVQELFNRTAVYMLKAVSSDNDFRNVLNGKMKDFAGTFSKYFIDSLPEPMKRAIDNYGKGESGQGGSMIPPELLGVIDRIFPK